jgi:hypothetical protein
MVLALLRESNKRRTAELKRRALNSVEQLPGLAYPHSHGKRGTLFPSMHPHWDEDHHATTATGLAHPCRICTGTGLAAAPSAPRPIPLAPSESSACALRATLPQQVWFFVGDAVLGPVFDMLQVHQPLHLHLWVQLQRSGSVSDLSSQNDRCIASCAVPDRNATYNHCCFCGLGCNMHPAPCNGCRSCLK